MLVRGSQAPGEGRNTDTTLRSQMVRFRAAGLQAVSSLAAKESRPKGLSYPDELLGLLARFRRKALAR